MRASTTSETLQLIGSDNGFNLGPETCCRCKQAMRDLYHEVSQRVGSLVRDRAR